MGSAMKEGNGTLKRFRGDQHKLSKGLTIAFIVLEALLIILVTYLFFSDLSTEYRNILIGLVVSVSLLAILLGWLVYGKYCLDNQCLNQSKSFKLTGKGGVCLYSIGLATVTAITVVVINEEVGQLAFLTGLFGGMLVWTIITFILLGTEPAES